MYRVNVTTKGIYGNVVLGARYCFRKKTAIELGKIFADCGCTFTLEKFNRIGSDLYCWSDEHCERLLEKIYEEN